MNILYINGHPYEKSFHKAIEKHYLDGIDKTKHKVKVLHLGQMEFDPVLRFGYSEFMPEDEEIKKSQELISWADHMVFAYPIWWGQMPSLISGWIARVFTPGHSYKMHGLFKSDKLLKGRTADIITTSRMPNSISSFSNSSTKPLVNNLFVLTGIKTRKKANLGGMHLKNDTENRRISFLKKVKNLANSL